METTHIHLGDAGPARFPPGRLLATRGALGLLARYHRTPDDYLARHLRGDWGELGIEDARANDRALLLGERLLSVYRLPGGETLWIVTEDNRLATTLLLPGEY